jgi:guanylate kinase
VVNALLAKCRFPLRRVITATTRPPRPGETDGVDYHFWTPERFAAAVAAGQMLEHAVVHGRDHYGTPRAEVDPHRAAGTGVLLVIDVQGAEQVRRQYSGDHLSVFLDVPSLAVLEDRLRARNTEDDARVARRLATARQEVARAHEFDRRVTNGSIDTTVRELQSVIEDQFIRRGFRPCSTS